ncbi:MAG: hypothetical protein LBP76_09435 [Treponema sp.]|jgi:hypothetical protein|nr:hypothetical protein [Treponema sp.]
MNPLDELKTAISSGTVPSVYYWQENGLSFKPPAPYVIIKPTAITSNYQSYQIWAHFEIGASKEIQEYVNTELINIISKIRNAAGQSKYRFTVDGRTPATDEMSVDQFDNTLRYGRMVHLPIIYG